MIKLRCSRVWFYSPADESGFFYFIKQIKAVQFVEGLGEDVFLHIKTPITLRSLRDLIGLFRRYNIDLADLKRLKNKKTAKIFEQVPM